MPKIERTVKIRQCRGGVHPRFIFGSPSVIARLTNLLAYTSEQAPQSLGLPRPDKSGIAMTTSFCRCEADEVSRSNTSPLSLRGTIVPKQSLWGRRLIRFAHNDNKSGVLAMTYGGGLKVP